MSTAPSSVITEVAGGIGRITLNRPEAMNAITIDLGARLEEAIRALGERVDVAVIVIRGAGGNFSAGGDFEEVQRLRSQGAQALEPLFENFGNACRAIGEVDAPVVAVVEGVAMAGGFELLEASDIALVRADARLCDNHINFGQVPGGGGSQRLAPLVGRQRALGHLLSGDRLSGAEAAEWGLAYRAFPADGFDDDVEAFLARLATRRREALVKIKRLVRTGERIGLEAGLALEFATVVEHIAGEAGGAGVTAFQSKGA